MIIMEKLLICLIIILFSCQQSESRTNSIKKNFHQVKKETAILKIDDFSVFWVQFRNAIVTNDSNKLINLTESTLHLIGREDSDPQIYLKGREIASAILFVANNSGYFDWKNNKDVSNRTLLDRNLEEIDQYNPKLNEQWINDFVFNKTVLGWRLSVLYTNTANFK